MSSIRNSDGIFINSNVFTEEATHFNKYGYYCADPVGSSGYMDYWLEQTKRRIYGYEVGGVRITGDHYDYLNFAQIKAQEKKTTEQLASKNRSSVKKPFFPSFWDGDYDYFHNVEIARYGCSPETLLKLNLQENIPTILLGGKHLCVGKARRKGFSYKNGCMLVNRYDLVPFSISIVLAFDKKFLYPEGTMKMVNDYINFKSKHTAWGKKRDFTDKIDHKKASYKLTTGEGVIIEDGFQSTIMALSAKDNPDVARGKDGTLILFEEAGKFPNLKDTLKATLPTLEDGDAVTGQIIVFGTGSGAEDKEDDWADFAEIYYNPQEYNMQVFNNVYDEDFYGEPCSYFFPDKLNQAGSIDPQGNSLKDQALKFRLDKYEELKKNSKRGSEVLNGYLQEYANKPSEAFLTSNSSPFPVMLLKQNYSELMGKGKHSIIGTNVNLFLTNEGTVDYEVLLDAEPLLYWKPKSGNLEGNVIIYEHPILDAEPNTYIISLDPIRETSKQSGVSINSAYVHRGIVKGKFLDDAIVASYNGRPNSQDAYYKQLILLSMYYNNALIMHENEVIEVRNFFKKQKKLHLLAPAPKDVINLIINESTVDREYGMHMVEKIKIAGLNYIKEDLITDRESGKCGALIIPCPGLLEELMKYNRLKDKNKSANYDRIMSFMMLLFSREQEEEGKIYGESNVQTKRSKILEYLDNQYNYVT